MTDGEMRELDEWIHGSIENAENDPYHVVFGFIPRCTTDPTAFSIVKREIERRGWSWESRYLSKAPRDICYRFTVHTGNWVTDRDVNAESEETAGCLALKAAVEAANEDKNNSELVDRDSRL